MNATRKVKLKDITGNLTCKLCLGYLVDATTIIECLHSFCKSCILKYLEKSADLEEKYCPVCDVQLHSTKPLTSIRSDLMLQEIVYKLVPGLFKNEMSRRRKFYEENQGSVPVNQLDSGQVFDELYITSDDIIHLSLDYVTTDVKLRETARRYLKCPAAVSVFILKKFIRGKYDLPVETNIDLMFGDRILPDDFLLMDIAYKYSWTMNGSKPLALSYRIKDVAKNPEIKHERTINDAPTPVESSTAISQDEATTLTTNKKKVCNENGSNIMPEPEGLKGVPIKLNGNIPREIIIGPIKTPNGKVRGRKRKHMNYSDIVIDGTDDGKSVAKRLKSEYSPKSRPNGMVQSSTQVEANNILNNDSDGNKEMKEVQLQISENGVMSARSGKERIILKMETPFSSTSASSPNDISNPSPTTSQNLNLPEKIHLSGNFHSKTGTSGVTEIICDKPDPISASKKPSIAKPGYVTLNIPNPTNALLSQPSFRYRTIYTDADKVKESTQKQNGETHKQGAPNGQLSPKKKPTKSKLMEKIKTRIASKGKDGENVIKAISDLGKLCNSVNGLSSTSNNETGNQEVQKSPGMNSLQMNSSLLQSHNRSKPPNGTSTNCVASNFQLPLALNFSPSSGMSVSMIPCTVTSATTSHSSISTSTTSIASCSPLASSTTPPKRLPHQTTVVNGDLKFTTSPKNILPKLEEGSTPKKPPKFFKSRHTASPVSSSKQKPPQKSESDSKRKTPTPNGSGLNEPSQKKVREQLKEGDQQATFNSIISQLHLAQAATSTTSPIQNLKGMINGGQSLTPLTHPMVSADKYSQHLSALSNLAGSSSDSLSSKLGIALDTVCATSNGNGLPLGMVPFVTDNYCSMPFLNQRHPMTQLALPFGFPYANLVTANALAMNQLQSTTPKSDAASGDLNLHPSKDTEKEKHSASLDLTVTKSGKNSPSAASGSQKEPPSSSLLANLLNSTSNPSHSVCESDSNKLERKRSKTPITKIPNGEHHHDKRPSQTFSPKPKQESNNIINMKGSPQTSRDRKDQKEDSKLSLLNGKKDAASTTENNNRSHTEKANGSGKAKPQNGSIESGTHAECSPPVQSGATMSSLTNNNNPTVSNNYDKYPTQSSDSAKKVQDSLDCAKTGSNEKGVLGSTTIGPKCGSA